MDIKSIVARDAKLTEERLDLLLSEKYLGGGPLAEAMRYSTLGGGKRIRAALTIEFCKLFGGTEESALQFAAAIEMVQAYSLIHDDLPCMDDDDMRRGKPSCHIAFGEATALLAGDSLLTYAFETVARADEFSPVSDRAVKESVKHFAYNIGTLGMAGGQAVDLGGDSKTYEELKRLHSMKTAALIKASATLGYLATIDGAPDESILKNISDYCECIGLAFQIKDDLLDVEGDASVLGKRVGVDEKNDRVNALTFLSKEEARAECEQLSEAASNAISGYEGYEVLSELAFWLNKRNK